MTWAGFFALTAAVLGAWLLLVVVSGLAIGRMIKHADDINDDE